MDQKFKLLFLCTGNSARSILGEYLLRRIDPARFESYSAGARPTGQINPVVADILKKEFKIDTSDARSKSLDDLKDVKFDFVITVCDNAKESCPIFPGQPIQAHWGSPDPAEFTGTEEEVRRRTLAVAMQIQRRIELFTSLPLEKMERLKLLEAASGIGSKEKLESEAAAS